MSTTDFLENLLTRRGITDQSDRELFLSPSYEIHFHDPFLMKDMDKAVTRLKTAIDAGEKITIYSDYDCDGIPGAVILHDFFDKVGYKNVAFYIPHRHDEGYGLHGDALETFITDGTKLLITIDLGITAVKEVARAQEAGIDVIITDHHEPHEILPNAFAILNPKQKDDAYPFDMLCGSGVAFKFVQGFVKKYGVELGLDDGFEKWLLDMAGLATLSDMVPLVGENRAIAYYGLLVFRKSPRPGLKQLLRKMDIDQRYITEDDITFMVTPRINAASRMDNPTRAFELLKTRDELEAGMLADHLTKINDTRKTLVATIMKEVKHALETREETPVIVIGNPKWQAGVLGLVAGKILDISARPVFVWGSEDEDGNLRGSCRSDGSVSVVEIMTAIKDSFVTFGGHELAGGFTVSREHVHHLSDDLGKAYEGLKREKEVGVQNIDATLLLSDVNLDHYNNIEKLAPYGLGHAKPTFLFENILVRDLKLFGKEKNHLELIVADGNKFVKSIAFFTTGEKFKKQPEKGVTANLIGTFELSRFAGRVELRLRIIDIL